MISIVVSRRLLVIVAAVLTVALGSSAVVFAAATSKSGGKVTAVKTVTATGYPSTDTQSGYVDVPGASVSMAVPSNTRALLLITFSGESRCHRGPNHDYCYVRVLVNGNEAQPGGVVFDSGEDAANSVEAFNWETNSMQFVYGPVAAGTHTVKVQFRFWSEIYCSGECFTLGRHTLSVLRSTV